MWIYCIYSGTETKKSGRERRKKKGTENKVSSSNVKVGDFSSPQEIQG